LLPLLKNNTNYIIDIFIAINDENENCNYYELMKSNLTNWLKGCIIKKYIIPNEIKELFNPTNQCNLQKIDDKYVPNNCLSMYYNDNLSFNLACNYADANGFEYDIYMKYRSDIINNNLLINVTENNYIQLNCVIPICNFTSNGLFKKPIVSDAFAWGNRKTMNIYCNTYDYVLKKIKEYNGNYYVAYECSLTDNIYENNVPITYYNIPYSLDKNRRMFDDVILDSRSPIPNQNVFIKITCYDVNQPTQACKQE
jgi:hypothetical protein